MSLLDKKRDTFGTIAVGIIVIQAIIVCVFFYSMFYLITNPEIIGEFLGKIANGYNETK